MIQKVRRHVQVENDILDLASWIAGDNRAVAFRFLEAVEETISSLRHMPGKGSPKNLRGRDLAGVRSWAVRGFPNHLILYELRPDGIYIFAIVQGSRRYTALLRRRARDR